MSFSTRMIAAAAVLACLLLVILHAAVKAGPGEPNVIFILTDDQRLEDIKHMPILQRRLVQQGMQFDNFFSNVSLCCPSRTSILRGQFAHNTGVMSNFPPNGGFTVAHANGLENSTVAVWLHDRGYKTALIGKYLNHYPGDLGPTYIPPGWDYWASSPKGDAYGEYNYTLNENGKLVAYGNKPEDYGTDVYTNKAVEFIKSSSSAKKPFFVYLAFYAPHAPATPAPRHMKLFADAKIPRTKAYNEQDLSTKPQFIQKLPALTEEQIAAADAYYGKRLRSLQAVDEAIETVCKTLEQTHQLENTYIFFAADNGFHLGEHRMLRGKMTAYETDIHLPLIVRGPGIKQGARASEIVGNIDLAPTFAQLAGALIPDFVDGRSIVALLKGEEAKDWRQMFLVEHWRGGRSQARRLRGASTVQPAAEVDNISQSGQDCRHSPACTAHCAHMATCYCCNNGENKNAPVTTALYHGGSQCQSCNPVEMTLYGEEERAELAQDNGSGKNRSETLLQNSGNQQEDSLQMVDPTNSDEMLPGGRGRGRGARRRQRQNAASAGELGGIPRYSALRQKESTFVEYETGEREYYQLVDDPDEVNNLANKTGAETISAESKRLKELSSSAAKAARQLESKRD